jgi:hypothetical protein
VDGQRDADVVTSLSLPSIGIIYTVVLELEGHRQRRDELRQIVHGIDKY